LGPIDTHCHLTHPRLAEETAELVDRAREAGLVGCITVGTGVADGRQALALSRAWPGFVHCTVGIDPFTSHRLGERFADELRELDRLLAGGGFVALGEVGLDYHYDLDPRSVQAERFAAQLELAECHDLPVVIHVREAHEDMLSILAAHRESRGVIHSFSGGPAEAERYVELGWHLGINGVVTFKNAEALRQAAQRVPTDRLVVETDSPYLAPVPLRGKRCEPAYVTHTLRRLAEIRDESAEELAARTTATACRLWRL